MPEVDKEKGLYDKEEIKKSGGKLNESIFKSDATTSTNINEDLKINSLFNSVNPNEVDNTELMKAENLITNLQHYDHLKSINESYAKQLQIEEKMHFYSKNQNINRSTNTNQSISTFNNTIPAKKEVVSQYFNNIEHIIPTESINIQKKPHEKVRSQSTFIGGFENKWIIASTKEIQ